MGKTVFAGGNEYEILPWGGTRRIRTEAPANTEGNAIVGDKRDREGDWVDRLPADPGHDALANLLPGTQDSGGAMSGESTDAPMIEAARSSASSSGPTGGNAVSKETPISIAQPSYGLQETHTTILPWTGWFTAAAYTKTDPLQLAIRGNSIFDFLPITITGSPGDGNAFSTKGFYSVPIGTNGKYTATSIFPVTMSDGTLITEKPGWRDYWTQIYQYYTVLGMEYEIVLVNPISEQKTNTSATSPTSADELRASTNTATLIGVQWDSYSNTATATGNVMPVTKVQEMLQYKNIQWHKIGANNNFRS